MHRRVLSLLFVVFSSVMFMFADEGEWYWNQPIAKIDYSGLKNVKKSDLTGISSRYIDQPLTEDVFNEVLDALYALEYFDEINPYAKHYSNSNDQVLLVFEVVERPVIKSISFSGNKKIRNGELREKIKQKSSDVYVEAKMLVDERTIRNHYLEKGYTTSTVSHKIEETPNGVVITYVINEGASTVIKDIDFEGNTVASDRTLKNKMTLKEVGLFKNGAYQPSTLEQDKQKIISYYREHGYADANILDVQIESTLNEDKQRNELKLTFIIQEGVQYKYSGLTITGNEVFSDKELLSNPKMKTGAIYNETKFQEDLTTIQSVYYENGYMSNSYNPTIMKDSDHHEIAFNLDINESSRSHIENIIIKGNTKTKDYVIRREIPIEPGDIFSRDKIINGLRSLTNLQYFSSVVPEPQQGSEENLVDLIWSVEEQSTANFQFGLTFSGVTDPNSIPISLYLKVENSNLFGEGKTLSASTTLSNTEQSLDFTYSQNWIGNLPIGFSQTLSVAHSNSTGLVNFFTPNLDLIQDYYYVNYQGWTASLNTAVARRWSPDYAILSLSAGLGNYLVRNVYDDAVYVPVDMGINAYANRWGLSNSIYTSFSVDNRDVSYDPTRGWFASEKLSWYGLLPKIEKERFLRSDAKLEGYFKLFDIPITETYSLKLVLAGYTGLSTIFPTETGVSDSSKLYIDGMFNGRGWTEIYRTKKGMAMLSNKLEFRVPLVPGILGVDFFVDGAAVKNTVSDLNTLKLEDFYFSYGPGVRFLMPQFPLHLIFAWKFKMDNAGQIKYETNPFQFVLSFNITNR